MYEKEEVMIEGVSGDWAPDADAAEVIRRFLNGLKMRVMLVSEHARGSIVAPN